MMSDKIILVIHGGAGNFKPEDLSPQEKAEYEILLREALEKGYAVLERGGSALEAVEASIVLLEDSPLFNAGRGSVLTNDGKAELDASVMDGSNMQAGAVASVTSIKNPIRAALSVMRNSPHVLMVGRGAEAFAREQQLEMVDPSYFITEKSQEQLKRIREAEKNKEERKGADKKMGTVGAVALDKNGNLAAGTSTGGMVNKRFGRVGDSPIIGAGTYANNKTCAVSCTGHGEYFIRLAVAHDVSSMMEHKKLGLNEAVEAVIEKLSALGGTGGIIAVDNKGNFSMDKNTNSMFRGVKSPKLREVFIF